MHLSKLLPLIGTLVMCFGFTPQQPDLSSPKAAVESLLNAFIQSDVNKFARCIDGVDPTKVTNKELPGARDASLGKDTRFVVEISGDEATVAVSYDLVPQKSILRGTSSYSFVDMFHLKNGPGGWLIVPEKYPTTGEDPDFRLRSRPLQFIAASMLAFQKANLESKNSQGHVEKKNNGGECQMNLWRIAFAARWYASSNKDKLPPSASKYVTDLKPYLRPGDVLCCPLDAKGSSSYSMNVNLQGLSLAKITNPAKTVLLYEGKEGVLNFRHNGIAAVAFVDGNASIVNAAQAKSLIWTPTVTATARRIHK